MLVYGGSMKLRLALLTFSIMSFSPLYAADIYRWVDENGRIQFSDVVPEKYKKSAKRIDSRQYELSAEQRREADARAEQEKAQAAEATQRKARADAEKAANAAAAAAAAAAAQTKPRPAVDENTDCATLYRLYRESLDCFAPYITANGTTKAEAFAKCTPVADPSRKCGPAK
jgi:hypothetical protein